MEPAAAAAGGVGLDAAGVIPRSEAGVTDVAVGDRVYVNPWLTCGTCAYCRAGEPLLCSAAAFQGYFGFFPHSIRQLADYPFGGFSEYITGSPQRLVLLPPQVTFDQAARFGYLGTSFAALRCAQVGGGSSVAINGVTGTLGVGAALLALGMGATRILGLGRNREVLAQVKRSRPGASGARARRRADRRLGAAACRWPRVDVLIDCSGRAARANTATPWLLSSAARRRLWRATEPLAIQPIRFMTTRLVRGSNWFWRNQRM